MSDAYPVSDSPWTFYFNGESVPRWGACWGLVQVTSYLKDARSFVADELDAIYCRIDHVGVVESADPEVFIMVIQQLLTILLSHRDEICASLNGEYPEVYANVLEAAFLMLELTREKQCAFWTTGYESDRLRLLEVMRCCHLPANHPEFRLAPHIRNWQHSLRVERDIQIRELHRLAQSGQFDKNTRKRLMALRRE